MYMCGPTKSHESDSWTCVVDQVRDCGIELDCRPRRRGYGAASARRVAAHTAVTRTSRSKPCSSASRTGSIRTTTSLPRRQVSSEENPHGSNFMGFSQRRRSINCSNEGVATYDQRERARIYRQLQEMLADEQPVLFAWALDGTKRSTAGSRSTDGPIDLTTRQWWWQLEKLTLPAD